MQRTPIIGITCDQDRGLKSNSIAPGIGAHFLLDDYIEAVKGAGGLPLLIPIGEGRRQARETIKLMDGLLLIGSLSDVDPSSYGQEPHPRLGAISPARTEFEIELIRATLAEGKPILGICGGMQTINVALGGTLIQDIPSQVKDALLHSQRGDPEPPLHTVRIEKGTLLHKILGKERVRVNSTHHQAVDKLARGLIRNACGEDGVTEGIEKMTYGFCLGVQWHPERVADTDESAARIFKAFVREVRKTRQRN
jgi:putative glutamine amidotransferase